MLEKLGVQDPAVEVEPPVRSISAAPALMRHEGGILDAMLHVLCANLTIRDAELHGIRSETR